MELFHSHTSLNVANSQTLEIPRSQRWQVCRRLQELDIPCTCHSTGGLQVEVSSPSQSIQVWSVVQQVTASRLQLVDWLNRCY